MFPLTAKWAGQGQGQGQGRGQGQKRRNHVRDKAVIHWLGSRWDPLVGVTLEVWVRVKAKMTIMIIIAMSALLIHRLPQL